jgi:hypothetical protein
MSEFFENVKKQMVSTIESLVTKKGGVEIVGESFYKDSFKQIRQQLKLGNGAEAKVRVELVQDPNNKHSSDGKAVAVFILGKQVGHVSRETSGQVYSLLDKHGGRKAYRGRIYFGDLRYKVARNSVSIDLKVPR